MRIVRVFYTDQFPLPLRPRHRFPSAKYRLLRERLVRDAVLQPAQLRVPAAASDEELHGAHAPEYVHRVTTGELGAAEIRRIGFPWSAELVERSRRSVGATTAACRAALDDGIAVTLAGGTHHAHADRGEGSCVFNDAAVAARAVQAERGARRVVILDCDVHQGNGTAAIFRNDRSVFTFAIFADRNFPFAKEPSDLDVPLIDGTTDEDYLEALDGGVRRALERAAADLAVYLAGADPFEGDRLGRLAVTKAGLAARDRLVLDRCRNVGIPVAIAMAGGYAHDIDDTVDIHVETVRAAGRFAER
jgi:acetoin utilization deacetylase AcuC-like enzyme